MSRIGLVVNVRGSWPDVAEVGRLGMRGAILRTVVVSLDELDAGLTALGPVADVCALLEGQTEQVGLDPGAWLTLTDEFCRRFKRSSVRYVEVLNEPDVWRIPPERTTDIVALAAPILAKAGFQPILPGLAGSDWPGYLTELVTRLPSNVRRLCFANLHPYGQRVDGYPASLVFGELADAMALARSLSGLPTVATESGIKVADAGGEAGQAEYVRRWCAWWLSRDPGLYPFACFFAWEDRVGTASEQGDQGFGLIDLHGRRRPAYDVFSRADKGVPKMPKYEFVLGVRAEADRLRALGVDVGEPVENEQYPYDESLYSYQFTTRGKFEYSKIANTVHFFPAAGR